MLPAADIMSLKGKLGGRNQTACKHSVNRKLCVSAWMMCPTEIVFAILWLLRVVIPIENSAYEACVEYPRVNPCKRRPPHTRGRTKTCPKT